MAPARKAKPTQSDEWVTLRQAALMLGLTRHTVLNRIVKGDLVGQHIAGRTVVSRESVERAKQESGAAT